MEQIKNRQLTKNFNISEFRCHDGTDVPHEYEVNVQQLAEQLQILRDECSKEKRKDCPLHINSGYRTPAYNAKLEGSAVHSQHMLAKAADITCIYYSPKQMADKVEKLIKAGVLKFGGLGRYFGFTHCDIRRNRARWGKN